jgi:transcriptional regulator with XRE-family HTH domain
MTKSQTEPDAIGQRLRWAREQAGLSQGQIAKMFGYHRPTISQIEAGQRNIRPDEVARLAEIYGVKEAWIIKGDSVLDDESDPRIELAARELRKLRKDDLDKILRLIKVMRSERETDRE